MPRLRAEAPEALLTAMARQDATALAALLRVPLRTPDALWTAIAHQGLTAQALQALARAALRSADAALALERMLQLLPSIAVPVSVWSPHGRLALAAGLAGSDAVCRYLTARPEIAASLCLGEYVRYRKPLWVMRHGLRQMRAAAVDDTAFEAGLRRFRVAEWVRIVARDLAGLAPPAVVITEISDMAEALLEVATRYFWRRERSVRGAWNPAPYRVSCGLAILAQGKLGAGELNVSSDIDIQFLCDQTDGTPGPRERTTRVAQRLVQALTRHDDAGFCFRVDLDLRPEGKKGALINSVAGAEHYYEAWGQSWERLALIRGRHIAGATWVTQNFLEAVRPFVFPRSLDMGAVEEISALKDRVHQERRAQAARRGRGLGIDIKRDPGCIREIELFVQILQLLHGGRLPALRTPSTLLALQRLPFAGILPLAKSEALQRAYLFFRAVENALQAADERQTHLLPDNPDGMDALARRLHRRQGQGPLLTRAIQRERRIVSTICRSLFATQRRPPAARLRRAHLALQSTGPAQRDALSALGFGDAEEAAGALAALALDVGGPFSPHASEKIRGLAAPLLSDMAQSPDPNQALRLFAQLNARLARQRGYLRLLAETPPLRRRLLDLLGTSEFLGRTILHFPELIDWLAAARDPATLLVRRAETMTAEVLARLRKLDGDMTADAEAQEDTTTQLKLRSLRRFKLQEQLRIGMLDLAGTLPLSAVHAQLTLLAEVCLRASWDLVRADLAPRLGTDSPRGFALIALGRLGAAEMGYGSDLDLLFIFDDRIAGAPDARGAVRLAQRLIQSLTLHLSEGVLYPIDTRLRPSGAQGPLVSSRTGFVQYHRNRAMLWERQALLRARPVAGDLELGTSVLEELADVRYPPTLPTDARGEIHRLRMRMETELAREHGRHSNIKTGRGGLVDLEFVVQYLQLRHAHAQPALQVTATTAALTVLGRAGLLPQSTVRVLIRAYRFLRLLEMRLRIVHDRPIAAVDFHGPAAQVLARRMGYGPRSTARLQDDYDRITRRVRRIYERVLIDGLDNAPDGSNDS